eukprot:14366365-Alexandrium_andersonii.AAC.1
MTSFRCATLTLREPPVGDRWYSLQSFTQSSCSFSASCCAARLACAGCVCVYTLSSVCTLFTAAFTTETATGLSCTRTMASKRSA